ncbi:hypothetical protein EOE18_14760 [Novosphingobium umbonatum]|uniref:Bro-N domain-containing protein n=1 Tax=Novosphingobium umbonatum TaxID=1908524 RepID=A0A437N109_9SPHN|nr:BRO family protein [Novosphingobium umbonatum]RVU03581.1 hypothetical protein EOE18_14760 [Novosphingobium umbonatum]
MTENTQTVFAFNDATIRTALIDKEPWFVANDVCYALGLSITYGARKHVEKLLDTEKRLITMGELDPEFKPCASHGGVRAHTKFTIVNESGLYKLIMRSDKKEALEFQHWIASEVLPSIRKTGKYALADHGRTEMPLPADFAAAFAKITELLAQSNESLQATNREVALQRKEIADLNELLAVAAEQMKPEEFITARGALAQGLTPKLSSSEIGKRMNAFCHRHGLGMGTIPSRSYGHITTYPASAFRRCFEA